MKRSELISKAITVLIVTVAMAGTLWISRLQTKALIAPIKREQASLTVLLSQTRDDLSRAREEARALEAREAAARAPILQDVAELRGNALAQAQERMTGIESSLAKLATTTKVLADRTGSNITAEDLSTSPKPLKFGEQVSGPAKIIRDETGSSIDIGMVVGIAPLGGGIALICNYRDIYLLDGATGIAHLVPKPAGVEALAGPHGWSGVNVNA